MQYMIVGRDDGRLSSSSKTLRILDWVRCAIVALAVSVWNTSAHAALSGTWTIPNPGASQATSASGAGDGLLNISTQQVAVGGGSGGITLPNNPAFMGAVNAYSETGITGSSSLNWRFDYPPGQCTGTATWRISFDRPVYNPIIHIDKLGGQSGFVAEGARLTFSQSISRLSGVGHFQAGANFVQRQLTGSVANNTECTTGAANGTACGSIRVDGAVNSFIDIAHIHVGPAGTCGTGDQIELVISVPQDLGDAPASYGGAVHSIRVVDPVAGGDALYLGGPPDDEDNSQTSANATGDGADEDAWTPPASVLAFPGQMFTTSVAVTNTTGANATVSGWIDWDREGCFSVG